MIDPTTLAIVSGGAIVALAMVAGHYAFMPPRLKLHPLLAYVYGVVFCAGVAPALWAIVTGDWRALFVVWLMFGVAGLTTAACYALDAFLAARAELHRTKRAAGDANE